MGTDIVIIGIKEIMMLYGFSRKQATKMLNMKGCPVLPREDGENYRVIKDEFERWMRNRRVY